MDSFIAIDYETANSSYESVCAIGISFVEGQEIKSNFYTLIKPEEEFAFFDSNIQNRNSPGRSFFCGN